MGRRKKVKTILSSSGIKTTDGNSVEKGETQEQKLGALQAQFASGSPVPDDEQEQEQEQERPRRGRRSNAEIEADRQAELAAQREAFKEKAQSFAAMSGVILDIVCARLPNPLPPSPEEKEFFAAGVGAIAEKYLPQAGGYDAEISLALAAAVILIPRMVKQEKAKEQTLP